jgi:hypothetical protein
MSRFYEYRRRDLLGALIFGSCFYLLAKLSVSLPGKSGDISYIWLANGLAVGLLMRLKQPLASLCSGSLYWRHQQ